MQFVNDNIVYIWLIPVVLQIIFPLVMLAAWSIKKLVSLFSFRREVATRGVFELARNGIEPLEKAA